MNKKKICSAIFTTKQIYTKLQVRCIILQRYASVLSNLWCCQYVPKNTIIQTNYFCTRYVFSTMKQLIILIQPYAVHGLTDKYTVLKTHSHYCTCFIFS